MSPLRPFRPLLVALACAFALPAAAQQPAGAPVQPAPLPQPQVGDVAPDFTIPGATKAGVTAAPVRLSELRGQVVVLAFFPRARTSGCTVQMKAYRDQYDSLFKGHAVKVIAVSTDADTTLAAWAKELGTPVTFGSDSAGTVGRAYGSLREGARGKADMRHLYVIDPKGRVAHRMVPFNELSADSYTELAAAVAQAAGH